MTAITLWANRKKLENTSACWPTKLASQRCEVTFHVAVALANKTARIAWAVMHRHENYQRVAAAA